MTIRMLLMHFENPEMKVAINQISSCNLPSSMSSLKTLREILHNPGFAINEGMKTVINWKLRQDNVLEIIVA